MRLRFEVVILCCLVVLPETVLAHGPIEGIGNFYNGILHPVFVPAHLLLISALGLLIGQRGIDSNLSALATFASGTFIGLTLAWFSFSLEMQVYLLSAALILGLLVSLDLDLRPAWVALIAFFIGIVIGTDSSQESLSGRDKFVALFGTGVGLYLLQLYPMGLADTFNKKPWQKIGIRVVGSWIAAIAFLVLALAVSPVIN